MFGDRREVREENKWEHKAGSGKKVEEKWWRLKIGGCRRHVEVNTGRGRRHVGA